MKKVRRKVSVLLIAVMIFSATATSFAAEKTESFSIKPISESSFMVCDSEVKAIVSSIESGDKIKINVKSLDENNAIEGYFIADKNTGNIYSDFTGKTINVSELLSNDVDADRSTYSLSTSSSEELPKIQISYYKLNQLCGDGINAAAVAAAILAMISVAYPGAAGAIVAADIVLSLTSIGLSKIQKGIKSKSKSHGLQVRVILVKTKKHQGGRVVTGYKYTLSGVEEY